MVLCPSCLSTLATGLYFSPARAEEYIGENSSTSFAASRTLDLTCIAARGFLALVDDAVASLESNMQMENIGHHELARILEGELAVVSLLLSSPSTNRRSCMYPACEDLIRRPIHS